MPDKNQNSPKDTKNIDNENDITLEPTEEETGEENIQQKLKNLREKLAKCSKSAESIFRVGREPRPII